MTQGAAVHYLRPSPTRTALIKYQWLLGVPVLLFSIVAHEYAHAEAAYRQGDPTAYMLGRLTLNPLKHIDPFLTILLPAFLLWQSHGAYVFGGAKPVPVNPRNYRNFVRGDIIVSLAGIAVNMVLFVVFGMVFVALGLLAQGIPATTGVLVLLQIMALYGMSWNLMLAFFNLIPIPPLDGSHVFYHLLPPAAGAQFRQLQRFGFIPILALSWFFPGVIGVFLWPAQQLFNVGWVLVGPFAIPGVG